MSNPRLLLAIVTLCSACGGSSFEAGGSGGSSGSTADAGTTGSNAGSAGTSSGGSAGDSSAGGQSAGGTATAGAGGSSAGGSSAGGSSAGAGGASAGGSSAGAGGSSGCDAEPTDCAKLSCEYAAAVELARVCDKGSTNQCTASSTLPTVGGCGCPTLVNAKSEATTLAKQKYQAFQNAKCPVGPVCNIACPAYTGATCSAAAVGNAFVCTASRTVVPTN